MRLLRSASPYHFTKLRQSEDEFSSSSDQSSLDETSADDLECEPSREKRSWSPFRLKRRTQTKTPFFLLASLMVLTNGAYFWSLMPAETPKQMNRMLGALGLLIFIAVSSSTVQVWTAIIRQGLSFRLRWAFISSQLSLFIFWAIYDHGNDLQRHGAYNLLIFGLMFFFINILLALLWTWFRFSAGLTDPPRSSLFFKQLAGGIIIMLVAGWMVAKHKQSVLDVGFFRERMVVLPETCRWDEAVPWFDLIPFRINFFMGWNAMNCPKEDSFTAQIVDERLTIDCDIVKTQSSRWSPWRSTDPYSGPAFAWLPKTENWSYSLKNDSLTASDNMLQQNVLKYSKEHTYDYTEPVLFPKDVDTALAYCGKAQPKLVWRLTDSSLQEAQTKLKSPPEEGLNVVTLFIDAVSRPMFHRRLPKLQKTLEELTVGPYSESTLYQFWRYHTIGLNTSPNTRALWAGLESVEHKPAPEDVTPPIWEQFESAGFASGRVDPMCQDWVTYYEPNHLRENQTAGDFVTPRISHEHIAWSCFPPYMPVGQHFAGNFAGATSITARCISGTHVGWHELDWASSFLDKYRQDGDEPRATYLNLAFMEGHEGSGEVLSTLDDGLVNFLNPRTSPIDFSNTAVLILSDHGALMGLNNGFFESGHIEAANPFAAMILPKAYVQRNGRHENFDRATQQLVTAFDFYETTRGFMGAAHDDGSVGKSGKSRKGYDMLRERLPARSCAEAGIAEEACKCH